MIKNMMIIAAKEIRDARRSRWFLFISIIFAGLAIAFSLLGVAGLGNLGISGFGRTTASLINLVILLVPLMGLLLGSLSLTSEKEHGTLRTLLAQPVTAVEVFTGKFIGAWIATSSTLALGFGLSGLLIGFLGGWDDAGHYFALLAYSLLLASVYLGIGFLISVFAFKTATAVGVALFLWFIFIFMSDLGIMGTTIALNLNPKDILWIVLSNPTQSFKAAVIGTLQGDLDILGTLGRYAIDVLGPNFRLVLTSLLMVWIIVSFLIGYLLFRRKCGE